MSEDGFHDLASLAQPFTGQGTLNPPSAIARAVELGTAWAEAIVERICRSRSVVDWPIWPVSGAASARARRHAERLVAELHVHVAHRRHEREAQTPEALQRHRAAGEALVRLCYEAARTRYAELAAWRLR